MAREHARINMGIWQDPEWRALPPQAQHLYFTLWAHPGLSYCGVVDWRPGRIAAGAQDWTAAEVRRTADCLRARHFIVTDDETEECLIRSWVRWDELMKQPRIAVSYANAFGAVASNLIRGVVIDELVKLQERDPDLPGLTKPQVVAMLDLPRISARDAVLVDDPFGHGFGDNFGHRFGDGLGQTQGEPLPRVSVPVSVPPTPVPVPTPVPTTPPTGEAATASRTRKPRKHRTRLLKDWQPSRESVQKLAEEFPNYDTKRETVRFVDYYSSNLEERVEWESTWRNWMRKEAVSPRNLRAVAGDEIPWHQR